MLEGADGQADLTDAFTEALAAVEVLLQLGFQGG
jgi:hypothetical protein